MSAGQIILRNEDLDASRCRSEYVKAAMDDLRWLGLSWNYGPISQSDRKPVYRLYLEQLLRHGHAYACYCSRRDIQESVRAPHESGDEPIYPGICRDGVAKSRQAGRIPCIRFRVPDSIDISFHDGLVGVQHYRHGTDFGDFVIWRQDGIPSYQLAVVVDDYLMGITEVVRGQDLLKSTARQILIYQALGWHPPKWLHCPLVTDAGGIRLAKRHQSQSLREMREQNLNAMDLVDAFESETRDW